MAVLYTIGNTWTKVAYTLFSKWTVEGREYVPPAGRLIIVANHQSNADPPIVAASLPRRACFFAKRGLFYGPIASAILRALGVYPLNRDGRDCIAALWGLQALREERALLVFPEGTRSPRGMRRARSGPAYLALKTQAPILPVGITGTENISSLVRVPFPFCRVRVHFGEPFSLPVIEGDIPRAQLQGFTEMIMRRVAQILPPEYRGVYGDQLEPPKAGPAEATLEGQKLEQEGGPPA